MTDEHEHHWESVYQDYNKMGERCCECGVWNGAFYRRLKKVK